MQNEILGLLKEAYKVRVSDLDKSIKLAQKAQKLSKKNAIKPLLGKSLNHLSLFNMIIGNYDLSIKLANKALVIFEELNDDLGIAEAKYNVAGVYYKTNNLHSGLMNLIDCQVIYRKHNNYHQLGRTLKSLGTIYEYFGDERRAVNSYIEVIEIARKVGDSNLESNALNPLSGVYLNQGKIEKALKIIEKSMEMKQKTGDIRGLAFAYYGRAKVYTETKEFEKAEQDFDEAIRIHKEMGEKLGFCMALHKLGYLYYVKKDIEKAKNGLSAAVEFANNNDIALIKYKCNYLLYKIYSSEKNTSEALKYLECYITEKESVINMQSLKIIENYEMILRVENLEKEAQMQRETADIIKKKNLAVQEAKVKQDFLSTMSHEIRTPLNAVITISSLLNDRNVNDEQQLVDALNFSAKNLLYIINDILDYTKLDANKVKVEARACNLFSLLDNLRNIYLALANEKGIRLNLVIKEGVNDSYSFDETKLSQILGNLISNAIKFTDTGSVDLIVEKKQTLGNIDQLNFTVIDTGIGISKKHLSLILESFYQPKMTKSRKHEGSGLGLAIVKKLLALHNSSIRYESELGLGSKFEFDIDFKRVKSVHEKSRVLPEPLTGKSILLAEDNKINAMVVGKLLSRWGVAYEHAQNGKEVVEMSKVNKYDCILMDIHMPIMDGFEATSLIKKTENVNKYTPVIALTADITAEKLALDNTEFKYCFDGFLLKPIDQDKLYNVLKNA